MKNNLLVNPFIQFTASNEPDKYFILTAPKLQSGLQTLKVSKAEQPNLHEVFLDLSAVRFDMLDVELDIDETERELLYQYGILIEPENIPQKPLFACYLDEVENKDFEGDVSAVIVNPAFRFEPFDFTNSKSWISEKCFSSGKSSVWIKQPVTDIEMGYWLDNVQAETVSKFTAGEKLPCAVEPELLSKLMVCGILTTPEMLAENERTQQEILEKAKIKYERDKYVVLQEILPAPQMTAMRRYYREYVKYGFMPFDDSQSERFYQHNEPLARVFHKNLTRLMSLIIGEEVIPSYVYAASYIENADLKPHTDRAQCEFSISFQVDYLPEPENHLSPWGLFVWKPDFAESGAISYSSEEFPASAEAEDKNPRVYLASGDGLVYKGRELIHYRYTLPRGHQSTSLFFHYVPKDFEGKLN
jgi:hypothetical protein